MTKALRALPAILSDATTWEDKYGVRLYEWADLASIYDAADLDDPALPPLHPPAHAEEP